ncbi:MAG: phage tail protein [Gemmatimonadaceae bacterium]
MSTEIRRSVGASTTYTLVASLEGTELQRLEVTTTTLTIGRLPENALVLRDQAVSRRHAELRLDQGQPMLADVGSGSGTFLRGVRLLPGQPVLFEPGAEVRVGPYVLSLLSETTIVPPVLPPVYAPPGGVPVAPDLDELPAVVSRPTWPAPLPTTDRSRYLQHLPSIYQDTDFLGRMLLIYEAIWEPLEQRQEHIAMYFSPVTCPAQMLAWMAEWLNLELDAHWPERRRRELLREAMQLYWWRGTRYGLTRMLEICTDQPVKITEDPDKPFVFRIAIPTHTDVSRDFIERLVRAHKPAHVGYVLETSP